uniref:Reverse transcriptase RNase H-like domain-containing protein n=1 Tax=Chenopodium quinoa TaxID=63459 RepID=A0A803MIB2_CHEQI
MEEGEEPPHSPNWKHVNCRVVEMNVELPLMKEHMGSIEESLEATRKMQVEMLGKLDNIAGNYRAPSPHSSGEVEDLRREIEHLQKRRADPFKLKIPDPKPFSSDRNAKDVENFLWDIEHYFRVSHVPHHDKVSVATMYLVRDTKLWWRSRVELNRAVGRNPIQEWVVLKRELKSIKTWAQTELRGQNFRTFSAAFAAADALVDLKPGNTNVAASSGTNNKWKCWNGNKLGSGGCFTCGGPHFTRDCPKKGKLGAMVAEEPVAEKVDEDVPIRAMVDTGTTHNFVSEEATKKLNLPLFDCTSLMKAVNSDALVAKGSVHGVNVQVSSWKGKTKLIVVTLDDFKLILGNEFIRKAKASVMPYLSGMFIGDEDGPCFVKGVPSPSQSNHVGCDFERNLEFCSALQVRNLVAKGKPIFLAALVEISPDKSVEGYWWGVVQDAHPIAFESPKLKGAEERYTTHEKEMLAVVHCLMIWRVYLLGTKFVVKTNNVANTYFKTQPKLSPKQARRQEFLGEYDFEWEHKPSRHSVVPDALSRRFHELVAALTAVESNFTAKVRTVVVGDASDPMRC